MAIIGYGIVRLIAKNRIEWANLICKVMRDHWGQLVADRAFRIDLLRDAHCVG